MGDEEYSKLMFPEFQRIGVRGGGAIEYAEGGESRVEEPPHYIEVIDKTTGLPTIVDRRTLGTLEGSERYSPISSTSEMIFDSDGRPVPPPELDLRKSGGRIIDTMGSGDEDTVNAKLADGEFVMTKQSVMGMGNGDHEQGIETLYAMMNQNENRAQQMGIGRA